MKKANFIIIGGQKCGSTFLHHILEQHPEISMLPGEHAHFESPEYEKKSIHDLNSIISELDFNKVIGFKRPSYLLYHEAPSRIIKYNKDIKLIVILRNPIDRFMSAYFHQLNNGVIPINDINNGIDLLLKKELRNEFPRSQEIIDFGFYFKGLKRYLNFFDQKQVLILTHDELKNDKNTLFKKCFSFLDVDSNFDIKKLNLNVRPQKVNYSLLRARIIRKRNSYQYNYNKDKTRLYKKKQSTWEKILFYLYAGFDRLILIHFISDKKPTINRDLKKKLLLMYINDINSLEALIERDLSAWKK